MGKSGGIVLRHDDGQNGASIRDYSTSKRATGQCPLSISMIGFKFLIITCKQFMFLARVSTKGQGEAHGKKTDTNICLVRSVEKHGRYKRWSN